MTINTIEEARKYRQKHLLDFQKEWARDGISTVVVNGEIDTVGDGQNYPNFKAFCVAQMADMGMKKFADKTDWDCRDMLESLVNDGPESDIWFDAAVEGFDAMEGDY